MGVAGARITGVGVGVRVGAGDREAGAGVVTNNGGCVPTRGDVLLDTDGV